MVREACSALLLLLWESDRGLLTTRSGRTCKQLPSLWLPLGRQQEEEETMRERERARGLLVRLREKPESCSSFGVTVTSLVRSQSLLASAIFSRGSEPFGKRPKHRQTSSCISISSMTRLTLSRRKSNKSKHILSFLYQTLLCRKPWVENLHVLHGTSPPSLQICLLMHVEESHPCLKHNTVRQAYCIQRFTTARGIVSISCFRPFHLFIATHPQREYTVTHNLHLQER